MSETNNLDRKDLKIQALLEKVSSLTTKYENDIADYRVEITVLTQQKNEVAESLGRRIQELEAQIVPQTEENEPADDAD